MSKLKLYIVFTLTLWLTFCGMATAEQFYVNESGWWQEGGMFNASTAPIQAAVDAAGAGDAVYVWNGSYCENVDVDQEGLTLEGEGEDVVTVSAVSYIFVFEVTADRVTISEFTMNGAGIYLCNATHCNISNNNISNTEYGIYLYRSNNNTLTGNTASNNWHGIYLLSSRNNTLTGNTASNNHCGISLSSSSNNTLTGNIASDSWRGIYLLSSGNNILSGNIANSNDHYGISVLGSNKSDYNNSIGTINLVNGKPVYYFFNKTGITWDGLYAGHLTLAYCSDCTIKNSNVSNGDSICLFYSSNNTLTGNIASDSWRGIYLLSSSNNILSGNIANLNNGYGIYIVSSNNSMLTENTANSNKYDGICISGSNETGFDDFTGTTNIVNGEPVYRIFNKTGIVGDGLYAGHLTLAYCTGYTIKNSNVSNGDSIRLFHSRNNILYGTTASSNSYNVSGSHTVSSPSINNTLTGNIANSNHGAGICVYGYSNKTTLVNNTANLNNDSGIYLFSSSNNTLTGNTANLNNGSGIYLSSSSNNNITCNRVRKNTRNGFCLYQGSTDNSICYNNIVKNGNHNKTSGGWRWQFYNGQSTPCEAKHNYWGARMNNNTIDASIYVEEISGGGVVFYPFEIDPITGIPVALGLHTSTIADAAIALEIASGIPRIRPILGH
ncbi:MAG: hypothetical protein C5S48_06110 [Candidatus Methanogaster sp.]|nr:MAG: hypothetical protein C5S48_06110 [ANME-2 cluster archaeon]